MEDITKKTTDAYNELAEHYSQTHFDVNKVKYLLDEFLSYLKEKQILDAGCGPGRDSKYFSEKGYSVTGIDLSEKFLKIARSKVQFTNFIKMDLRKLGFANESFDGIWCCASLLHILKNQAKQTLIGFYKVLKSEGILFLSVKEGYGEKFLVNDDYKKIPRFYSLYQQKELENLVEEAGFKIMNSKKEQKKDTWICTFAEKMK